jgi:hypothetical protein
MACLLTYVLAYGGAFSDRGMESGLLPSALPAVGRAVRRVGVRRIVFGYGNDRVYVRSKYHAVVQRLLAYSLMSCGERFRLCHISSCLSTCLEWVSVRLIL